MHESNGRIVTGKHVTIKSLDRDVRSRQAWLDSSTPSNCILLQDVPEITTAVFVITLTLRLFFVLQRA